MKREIPSCEAGERKLRLLVHCVDGSIPYLTPSALERYFPPSNDFWIGLAVRDTCITPSFETKKKKNKDSSQSCKANETNHRPKKPTGYTFRPTTVDPWLLPYTRVTVPAFDLGNRDQGAHSSSNSHVSIWTPHGRQKLTPELYAEAGLALNSNHILSMYDIHDEGDNAKVFEKVEQRNKTWYEDLCRKASDMSTPVDSLWAPILLQAGIDNQHTFGTPTDDAVRKSGVALIGKWQQEILNNDLGLHDQDVALLATNSLLDIIDAASGGIVNVIGSDLPARWAKKKRALAIVVPTVGGTKRTKLDKVENIVIDEDGCMDLDDNCYSRDPGPLLRGCSCMACNESKFSRSYIHHLVVAQELLAEILLFGHNLHVLLSLIRSAQYSSDIDSWRRSLLDQLPTI